ncbi:DUF4307 domain-containing protein [Streptomyces sp. ISL-100]|uniref:DUF4307 domain-containing protein n=1 Tax=Streptomyces sp. ISL-100 TaxID=2819173 RepID=UPI001BEBC8F4|nr:DUF4307 domain-containing protein [Streptomyces sp. ISL-100]MBT2395850.1 DUF4307 domain-containing protein [Streptomyces sp. ISL-100]
MTAVRQDLPEGRYGRSADERADRKLKIVGAVLGAGLLAMTGWFGYDYVTAQQISAELIKFDTVSDSEVKVHLEVRKKADAAGTCTLRSLAEDGAEVGRRDVRIDASGGGRIDEIYTVRTTSRATSTELTGCTADGGSTG